VDENPAIVQDHYKYSALTARIIKAAMTVHGRMGCGFQEVIYQRALAIEMTVEELMFVRECEIPVFLQGH
jgi:GxxExxY protein